MARSKCTLHDPGIAENGAQRALVVERGEHEELARYVLVTALLRSLSVRLSSFDRSFEKCTSPPVPSTGDRRSSARPSWGATLRFAPALSSSGRTDPPSGRAEPA